MKIVTVGAWFFTIVPRYDPFLSLQSTPWFQAQFDLTLAALGKNGKKQQEVSDLNKDYELPYSGTKGFGFHWDKSSYLLLA